MDFTLTSTKAPQAGTTLAEYVIAVAIGSMLLRSEEHTSELQSQSNLVCRLLLEKKKKLEFRRVRSEKHTSELPSQSNLGFYLLAEKTSNSTSTDSAWQRTISTIAYSR